MEFLVELLVELFGELFFWIVAAIFSKLYNVYALDGTTKKTVKNICVFLLFGLVLGLLIYAIFTKRGLYAQIVLCYFIIMLFLRIGTFINRNYFKSKFFGKVNRIVNSILHYLFAGIVIYYSTLDEVTRGETFIIVLSCIGIVVLFTLDIFRIIKKVKQKRREKNGIVEEKEIYDSNL